MPLIEQDTFGCFTRVSGWIARPAYPSRLIFGARVSARIFSNTPLVAMGDAPHKRCLEIWVAVCLDTPHARESSTHIDHYALCIGELWLSIPDLDPHLTTQDPAKLGTQFCLNQHVPATCSSASYQTPNPLHHEGMRRIAMIEHRAVQAMLGPHLGSIYPTHTSRL